MLPWFATLVCLQPSAPIGAAHSLSLCLSAVVQEDKGISCELVDLDFLRCSVGFPFMRAHTKVAAPGPARPSQTWPG